MRRAERRRERRIARTRISLPQNDREREMRDTRQSARMLAAPGVSAVAFTACMHEQRVRAREVYRIGAYRDRRDRTSYRNMTLHTVSLSQHKARKVTRESAGPKGLRGRRAAWLT